MLVFTKKEEREAQAFIAKLVNNNCAELEALIEGPRLEGRVRLCIVVMVIPLEGGTPLVEEAFAAVTKEFSTKGVAIVVNEPKSPDEVILAFRWENELKFLRGTAKHLNPMGAGFYQLGVELAEVVCPSDYKGLRSVAF